MRTFKIPCRGDHWSSDLFIQAFARNAMQDKHQHLSDYLNVLVGIYLYGAAEKQKRTPNGVRF
jgi:hypothetical protein